MFYNSFYFNYVRLFNFFNTYVTLNKTNTHSYLHTHIHTYVDVICTLFVDLMLIKIITKKQGEKKIILITIIIKKK